MRFRNLYATFVLLCCSVMFAGLTVACGSSTPESASPTVAATAEVAAPEGSTPALAAIPTATPPSAEYPAPETVTEAYPGTTEGGVPSSDAPTDTYPPPAVEEVYLEPRFSIDQPVTANATTVSGQALPNTPIAVLDVTFNGAVLGTGRADGDGRFSIEVSPLIDGNRIGITVAELEAGQTFEQMVEKYFPHRGEGFMNIPNVGIIFDTVQVQP